MSSIFSYTLDFQLLQLLTTIILPNPIFVAPCLILPRLPVHTVLCGPQAFLVILFLNTQAFCLCSVKSDSITATSSGCQVGLPVGDNVLMWELWKLLCAPLATWVFCSHQCPLRYFLKFSLGCYFQPTLKKISSPDFKGTVAESNYNGTGMPPFIFYTF